MRLSSVADGETGGHAVGSSAHSYILECENDRVLEMVTLPNDSDSATRKVTPSSGLTGRRVVKSESDLHSPRFARVSELRLIL